MSLPASVIDPEVGVSRPATILSVVVLPHPEGPRRAKNEPVGTSRSRSSTALKAPKSFVRPRSSRPAAAVPPVGDASVCSARCDIGPVPFVLDLLLVVERHEPPRVLQHLVGGEDQLAPGGRLVELEHLLLGPQDGTDVVVPVRELRGDDRIVVV